MKHGIMCLTLALGALFAATAQAVTYTWTQVADGAASAGSQQALNLYANSSVTYAASITYGAAVGSGTLLSIGKGSNSCLFSVGLDASGNYVLTTSTSGGTLTAGTTVAAAADKRQTVALSCYRSSGTQMGTVVLSVDGVVVATLTSATITSGPIKWAEWGRKVGNADAYTGSAEYDAWFTQGDGQDYLLDAATIQKEVDGLLIPEPTALALLALGAAALALRRRAA